MRARWLAGAALPFAGRRAWRCAAACRLPLHRLPALAAAFVRSLAGVRGALTWPLPLPAVPPTLPWADQHKKEEEPEEEEDEEEEEDDAEARPGPRAAAA